MNRHKFYGLAALALFAVGCASSGQQTATQAMPAAAPEKMAVAAELAIKPIEPHRFDMGKMWTFENAPVDYFEEAYGFRATDEWLETARMAALRIPGCTASFVSANGLVMTNHHCGRGHVSRVTREGENLLDEGFYAETLEDERQAPNMWADQMIVLEDVTQLVRSAIDPTATDDQQVEARDARMEAVGDSASVAHDLQCSVTELYNGGKYSMYCFKRYTDVRLVMAPELQIGYFGGDPDNFTYPRYNLDFTFFRVYENGEPVTPQTYFEFDTDGVAEGDAVFVIGNPGSTERLSTFAQLEFNRDYREPFITRLLQSRTDILKMYMEHHPEERANYINQWFGWMNSFKLYAGRTKALNDPEIMGRKLGWEMQFRQAIQSNPSLNRQYGTLWDEIAQLREEMGQHYPVLMALATGGGIRARTLGTAAQMVQYAQMVQAGGPEDEAQQLRARIEGAEINTDLDGHMLEAQIADVAHLLGASDPFTQMVLQGRSPRDAARAIIEGSPSVVDPEARQALLDDPATIMTSTEPALALVREAMPRQQQARQRFQQLNAQEEIKVARLARALFDVYGTDLPPDATFTLRIADGVVQGYEYNGTEAPAWTTIYGLYDRHYAHKGTEEWALPDRWLNPPSEMDLGTPMNMVSTNDITGGNSGSPMINKDLEVVGLIFDGNIESLSGDFIYTTKVSRSVSVCTPAIVEALEHIYDAERIVQELRGM
jgi:hypothetical protein